MLYSIPSILGPSRSIWISLTINRSEGCSSANSAASAFRYMLSFPTCVHKFRYKAAIVLTTIGSHLLRSREEGSKSTEECLSTKSPIKLFDLLRDLFWLKLFNSLDKDLCLFISKYYWHSTWVTYRHVFSSVGRGHCGVPLSFAWLCLRWLHQQYTNRTNTRTYPSGW